MNNESDTPDCPAPADDLTTRMGKFSLRFETLRSNPSAALMVMATVIIVRAELMYASESVEYVAMCEAFAPGAVSDSLPVYHPIIRSGQLGENSLYWLSDAELKSQIPEIPSPAPISHQERLTVEKNGLDENLGRLCLFIATSPIFETLPDEEQARMLRQREVMADYSIVLGERIAAFTTPPSEPKAGDQTEQPAHAPAPEHSYPFN